MIESRKEAIAAGVRRYFTGKPCPKGHLAERSIDNCGCVACHADRRAENREGQRAYTRDHYRANKEIYIKKAKEWGDKNPDKVTEAQRKWRRENREAGNAASSAWQKNNPERANENARNWRRSNPDKARATCRKWARNNPDVVRARNLVAMSRTTSGSSKDGVLTGDDVKTIIRRQKGRCAACGEKAKLEMDHIMPLALGGAPHRHNFQGLCKPCNVRKHAKHPIDFNQSRGLLL
jgi:5-methylcytosine-specific restriction endonuclease McrA